uniref:Uncharacterized protein n=1 Tax=Vespula pensylvanica TaxID=30213 RepID=A0A834UGX6_VESPE|nr:hypothetical protein H0235_001597 [Vespula pensylvanica]
MEADDDNNDKLGYLPGTPEEEIELGPKGRFGKEKETLEEEVFRVYRPSPRARVHERKDDLSEQREYAEKRSLRSLRLNLDKYLRL